MIDTNKTQFAGEFSGFANDEINIPFSASYSGGSISAGSYRGPIRATKVLDNSNDISHIQVRFTGIETFYRLLDGYFQIDYPSRGSREYSIQVMSYYKDGLLYVDGYVIDQQGGTPSTPAFTMDCIASLYKTPNRSA